MSEKFIVGTRVQALASKVVGTIVDDYWRGRDRFTVQLDTGEKYDFSSKSLVVLNDGAPRP